MIIYYIYIHIIPIYIYIYSLEFTDLAAARTNHHLGNCLLILTTLRLWRDVAMRRRAQGHLLEA